MKLSDPIDEYGWSVRTYNCLRNYSGLGSWKDGNYYPPGIDAWIQTIGDLVALTREELLSQPNFGRRSLREVEELLGAHGFQLKNGRIMPWYMFCL